MKPGLYGLDIAIVAVYLIVVVGKGWLLGRGQKNIDDYFLAGRRMGWFPVGISLIASLFSAISYLGDPTEGFLHDLKYLGVYFTYPPMALVVAVIFLPFFYNLRLYTAYEYLQKRFNLPLRLLASAFFILWRLGWMAMVLYAPSLALSEFLGLDWRISVLLTGLGSTIYTVMGGMTAVIWTDVIQFFVLVSGMIAVIVTCIMGVDGGFGRIWNMARAAGKLRVFDFRLDPRIRLTTWGLLFGGFAKSLSAYGVDQVAVQRYLTTANLRESIRALVLNAVAVVVVLPWTFLAGTMIWAFYQAHPEMIAGFDMSRPDRILPFFVVQNLPMGLRGLLIAALFAATMSSVDSGINTLSTATLMDWFHGLGKVKKGSNLLAQARAWTIFWGLVTTGLAILIGYAGKTLVELGNTIGGLFGGPLLGIFLLGMLTCRANSPGVLLGALFGFAFSLFLANVTEVSFMYYGLAGCIVTMVIGWAASHLSSAPPPEKTENLVYEHKKVSRVYSRVREQDDSA